MTYEEFCKTEYPDSVERYKRKTTPNYYECGVEYVLTKNQPLNVILENCTMYKEKMCYNFRLISDNTRRLLYTEDEIYKHAKRLDENVEYKKYIIDDGTAKYLEINGIVFTIIFHCFRHYDSKRMKFRMIVKSETLPIWWEYYNLIGRASPILKISQHKKNIMDRENYEILYNVPVRRFKEIVFGDPNIKLPLKKIYT